jgi:hypothetical protein
VVIMKTVCKVIGLVLSILVLQVCNDKKLMKYTSIAYSWGHYDALNEINRRVR